MQTLLLLYRHLHTMALPHTLPPVPVSHLNNKMEVSMSFQKCLPRKCVNYYKVKRNGTLVKNQCHFLKSISSSRKCDSIFQPNHFHLMEINHEASLTCLKYEICVWCSLNEQWDYATCTTVDACFALAPLSNIPFGLIVTTFWNYTN